jgi:hypothetical protein
MLLSYLSLQHKIAYRMLNSLVFFQKSLPPPLIIMTQSQGEGEQKGERLSFFPFNDFNYHNADLIEEI